MKDKGHDPVAPDQCWRQPGKAVVKIKKIVDKHVYVIDERGKEMKLRLSQFRPVKGGYRPVEGASA